MDGWNNYIEKVGFGVVRWPTGRRMFTRGNPSYRLFCSVKKFICGSCPQQPHSHCNLGMGNVGVVRPASSARLKCQQPCFKMENSLKI